VLKWVQSIHQLQAAGGLINQATCKPSGYHALVAPQHWRHASGTHFEAINSLASVAISLAAAKANARPKRRD
jgi:hypothetical protein